MKDMTLWALAISLLLLLLYQLRRRMWQKKERHMLQKKYGDLAMFEDFFDRIRNEHSQGKGRTS